MENTGPDCELEVNEFHHLMGLLSMVEQNIAPAQAPKQACVTPTMAAEARIKELEEQLEMLSKKYTEVVKENDQVCSETSWRTVPPTRPPHFSSTLSLPLPNTGLLTLPLLLSQLRHAGRKLIQTLIEMETSQ